MGLFGKKTPQPTVMATVELRQGTQVPLVDVNPQFVEFARANIKRQPSIGHPVPVQVALNGSDIAVYYNGQYVARMEPNMVELYEPEFATLAKLGRVGTTLAYIKWDGAKTPHALSLNYGTRAAHDGGILPVAGISL